MCITIIIIDTNFTYTYNPFILQLLRRTGAALSSKRTTQHGNIFDKNDFMLSAQRESNFRIAMNVLICLKYRNCEGKSKTFIR